VTWYGGREEKLAEKSKRANWPQIGMDPLE